MTPYLKSKGWAAGTAVSVMLCLLLSGTGCPLTPPSNVLSSFSKTVGSWPCCVRCEKTSNSLTMFRFH